MAKEKILTLLAMLLIGGLVLYTVYFNKTAAPNVMLTSLSGQKTSINALKGKMVLVNFWATSCPGCVEEIPKIQTLYQRYSARGFEVLAVAMSYDSPNYVHAFASKNQLPFFIALDETGIIAQDFGNIQLTPTTILIDTSGNIIKRYIGVLNMREMQQLIESQLTQIKHRA